MTKHDSANPSSFLGAKATYIENKLDQQHSDSYKKVCSVISKQAENLNQDMQKKLSMNTQQVIDSMAKQSGIVATSNANSPITETSNTSSSITATPSQNTNRNKVVGQVSQLAAWFGLCPLSLPKLSVYTGTLASVVLFSFFVLPQLQSNQNEELQAMPFLSSPDLLEVVISNSDEELLVIEDLDLYATLLNEQL